MRKFISLLFLIATLLTACHTPRQAAEREIYHRTDTLRIVEERLVPVPTSADSAQLRALLECDSTGQVVLNALFIEQSKNANLLVELDKMGRLLAQFRTRPDTVYVSVADTTTTITSEDKDTETIYIEVERKRGMLESYLLCCGVIFNLVVVILIIFAILYFILKRKLS